MANTLESLYKELKDIKVYLIKIGPSRRTGPVIETKVKQAHDIYERYFSCLPDIDDKIKSGVIDVKDVPALGNFKEKNIALYDEILNLCKSVSENKDSPLMSTMATFDLKTALSLFPSMTDEENVTKQLIDNIEYYDSILTKSECKKNMINFVLKSRLSQSAKLKLKTTYDSVQALVTDMRAELLPKKAATAIQTRMQIIKQNDLTVAEFGKEITDLFVNLTVSQADGNTQCYNILKPINEKYAIKRFADGLRNRRLSTIISARNYSSLKDAIQGAQDEETASPSTSGELLGRPIKMDRPLDQDDFAAMEGQLRGCVEADRRYWRVNDVKCDAIYTAKTYEEFADRVAAAHLRPLDKADYKQKAQRPWNQYAAKE